MNNKRCQLVSNYASSPLLLLCFSIEKKNEKDQKSGCLNTFENGCRQHSHINKKIHELMFTNSQIF